MLKFPIICAAAIVISGCAATPFSGPEMTNRIVQDSVAFNQALAEASNSQILLNVLYARDRLPRSYAGFKDIATTQKRSLSTSPKIGGIALGNPGVPKIDSVAAPGSMAVPDAVWGTGELGFGGAAEASPSYGLSPLVGQEYRSVVIGATDPEVFKAFWDSGWPRDVLLTVLVERMVPLATITCSKPVEARKEEEGEGLIAAGEPSKCWKLPANGSPEENTIEAYVTSDDSERKLPNYVAGAIEIARAGSSVALSYRRLDPQPQAIEISLGGDNQGELSHENWQRTTAGLQAATQIGYRVESFGKSVIKLSRPDPNPKRLILTHNSNAWVLELRTVDKAIAYLGELVRVEKGSVYGPSDFVSSPDGGECKAPLFQIHTESGVGRLTPGGPNYDSGNAARDEPIWAAKVNYRGQWYFAGKASPNQIDCDDDSKKADRTATVLTLIGQILEINRSSTGLGLPARFN